jgi:thiosulfate/3-mercaptopyruvate sulfurtransferase
MKPLSCRRAGTIAVFASIFFGTASLKAQGPFGAPSENSAYSIAQAQLMQPAELNKLLHAASGEKPLVLQVGSRVLFAQAHIAGSEFIGPGSQPEGLKALQNRVAPLKRDALIVLYCGCCPWNRCPNVAPAYRLLQHMGFTRAKVLYMADNFGSDWVSKGYAVASGN